MKLSPEKILQARRTQDKVRTQERTHDKPRKSGHTHTKSLDLTGVAPKRISAIGKMRATLSEAIRAHFELNPAKGPLTNKNYYRIDREIGKGAFG